MNDPVTVPGPPRLHLFEGFGVELEYMVVDVESLSVMPVVDRVLEAVAGRIVAEVELGPLAWSNELVLHVVELKTNGPAPGLAGLDAAFQADVREINQILGTMGGMLLPTAMHPWMDPEAETRLWPHEHSPVYSAYDRVFGCRGHGWSNLQSTHLNLSFGTDEEFGRLHAAMRLLLPLIPALAASSPLVDGKPTGLLDNRMEVYRGNSARVPSVVGQVIPEPVFTQREYEDRIMGRMYADIAPMDPEGILRDEFLNSRGAMPRFGRGSIEIRVVDVQEAPRADLCIAALVVGGLQLLVREAFTSAPAQRSMDQASLVSTFLDCVRRGDEAVVGDRRYLEALGWRERRASAAEIWWHLLEEADRAGSLRDGGLYEVARTLLRRGPLAREILRALDFAGGRPPQSGTPVPRPWLEEVYRDLGRCLSDGAIFSV